MSTRFTHGRNVQCSGKRTFSTWAQAQRVAQRFRREGRSRDGVSHAYRCPHCGLFHTGNLGRRTDTKRGRTARYNGNDRNQLAHRLMLMLGEEED